MRQTLLLITVVALAGALLASAAIYLASGDILSGSGLNPTPTEDSLAGTLEPTPVAELESVRQQFAAVGALSVVVVQQAQLLGEWGDTARVTSVHSVRKSIVAAMFGIAASCGLVDLDATLAELGIDDVNPPLSDAEKQATLRHLLDSTSGIYHPSVRDDGGSMPERGLHAPGEHFFYNNWSFNAAGGIFEQQTGLTLAEAFSRWIAGPTGMQDFTPGDVRYEHGGESVFPAWRFWMSGRDLVRFGMLFLNSGKWGTEQIIPEQWVATTFQRPEGAEGVTYGLMWWVWPDGTGMATGTGGQKIWIDLERRLLVVTRVDTGGGWRRALWWFWGPRITNTHLRAAHQEIAEILAQHPPPDNATQQP